MKKILLTGSTGFLGRHIKALADKKKYKIYESNSKIGNLESYLLPSEPIVCGNNTCTCLSDVYLKKSNE
jgi:hypothetical protein